MDTIISLIKSVLTYLTSELAMFIFIFYIMLATMF